MTAEDGSCPLARAMRETLDAVVTPVVREALIHDALILAGLGELPQRGDAMRAFACDCLRPVVARALGAEMAASITEELLLTIAPSTLPPSGGRGHTQRVVRAPSQRRSHTPPPQPRRTPVVVAGPDSTKRIAPAVPRIPTPAVPSARRRAMGDSSWPAAGRSVDHAVARAFRDTDPAGPPPSSTTQGPSSSALPFLLVATLDPALLGAVAAASEGRARVCAVRTPAELVKRLDAFAGARCLVLLDGECPSLRPPALAVLLEDSPAVPVVFCRATANAEASARSVSASAESWTVFRGDIAVGDVAADCVRRISQR